MTYLYFTAVMQLMQTLTNLEIAKLSVSLFLKKGQFYTLPCSAIQHETHSVINYIWHPATSFISEDYLGPQCPRYIPCQFLDAVTCPVDLHATDFRVQETVEIVKL